jgi:hypothetical protein
MNAFPTLRQIESPYGAFVTSENGMTLLDYFAAKAMQSLIERREKITNLFELEKEFQDHQTEIIADLAYTYAQAMIKTREINNGTREINNG